MKLVWLKNGSSQAEASPGFQDRASKHVIMAATIIAEVALSGATALLGETIEKMGITAEGIAWRKAIPKLSQRDN